MPPALICMLRTFYFYVQEAIVLIVDVGETMTQRSLLLEAAMKAVTLLVQQKVRELC